MHGIGQGGAGKPQKNPGLQKRTGTALSRQTGTPPGATFRLLKVWQGGVPARTLSGVVRQGAPGSRGYAGAIVE